MKGEIKQCALKKPSIQYNQHDPCFTVLSLKGSTFWLITSEKCFLIIMHAWTPVGACFE